MWSNFKNCGRKGGKRHFRNYWFVWSILAWKKRKTSSSITTKLNCFSQCVFTMVFLYNLSRVEIKMFSSNQQGWRCRAAVWGSLLLRMSVKVISNTKWLKKCFWRERGGGGSRRHQTALGDPVSQWRQIFTRELFAQMFEADKIV